MRLLDDTKEWPNGRSNKGEVVIALSHRVHDDSNRASVPCYRNLPLNLCESVSEIGKCLGPLFEAFGKGVSTLALSPLCVAVLSITHTKKLFFNSGSR
jgi:hypothetical protein